MFAELMRAPLSRLVMFLCVTTLCACPGALMIWVVDPTQFKQLNSFQLITLSISLILPFILLNACVVSWSFGIHRWFGRQFRGRVMKRPREAVVAAASVFAGAVSSVIPAYAPLVAHVLEPAISIREMVEIAACAELVPLLLCFVVNPINYWQGAEEANHRVSDEAVKRFALDVNLRAPDGPIISHVPAAPPSTSAASVT